MAPSPRVPDEIFLEIFQHLSDNHLLPLAAISKHIQNLALVSCLSRYGITERDIQTDSFPPLSTSAFSLVRYITRIETLSLRLDPVRNIDRNVPALQILLRRLPVKAIELDFLPRPRAVRRGQCDIPGFIFKLISIYRVRPAVVVSPFSVSIVRPPKPPLHSWRRLVLGRSGRHGLALEEKPFREQLIIFPIMRAGGLLPSISLRVFDAPSALGSVLILRARLLSELRLPSDLRLSASEANALFDNLALPSLIGVEIQTPVLSSTSNYICLRSFIHRHPTIERLCIRGPQHVPCKSKFLRRRKPVQVSDVPALPPDALPRLKHIVCTSPFLAWLLSSPDDHDVFPQLSTVEIELHTPVAREAYANALTNLGRYSSVRVLGLQIHGWAPWVDMIQQPLKPEEGLSGIVELRLTFKSTADGKPAVRDVTEIKKWLGLWPAVRDVSIVDSGAESASTLCAALRKEWPAIKFTAYQLKDKKES
ncbi:hypothetical protein FB45DRAFT_895235 [Roridomyces roridus]|uniref:F-box domain-containing protein n=1 Tax=Roridomyces roridus TaxID=1738132 RepID=A0AAD7FXJ4_9AGAR|nr:hypothetical protein FB45DRAFT_895235 [Roridomyces roridus]